MRTHKSIRNSFVGLITNSIIILIGFISQKVFIHFLGIDYLGLNGLFTNIISMLSITELGMGTAIIYSLYEPIKNNDKKRISGLMNFYKKSYYIIGIMIIILGLIIIPFLHFMITDQAITIKIIMIYLLFILDSSFSYFIAYKRSILIANQDNYIVNTIHTISLILLNIFQIIILILIKNYYIYLILKIIFKILENLIIIHIVNKKYPYLIHSKEIIEETDKNKIIKNIKALFFHKIGGFIVQGTDNILISRFFCLIYVGIYSNYYMIIHAITVLFNQIFTSITSSIGNLIADKDIKKNYQVYKKIRFLNVWINIFVTTSILIMMNPFIKLWLGDNYLFNISVVISLSINLFLQLLRSSISIFKDAAGIYYEDRFVPLFEALTNIICSILFAKLFGIVGIFIGTICSNLVLHLYSYPKYVYKKLFDKTYKSYYLDFIKLIFLFIICLSISFIISNIYIFDNLFIELFKNIFIAIIIPNTILYVFYHSTKEYQYFKNLIKNIRGIKK